MGFFTISLNIQGQLVDHPLYLKIEQNFYEKGGVANFFLRLRLFYRYFCVVKKCDYFFID